MFVFFLPKFKCAFILNASDVKIQREHVQGSDDVSGTIKPEIEPITDDLVRRMERNPGSVEVCKNSSSNNTNIE
mgnify:CR=1 FL=1